MPAQPETTVGSGSNMAAFDRFAAVVSPYIKRGERHLTLCKDGMTTFAQVVAMQFRDARVDYTEFSPGGRAFLHSPRTIGSDAPEDGTGELGEYDSVSLFLTLHDYRDLEDRLCMVRGILPGGGSLIVIEYNFKPWIGRMADPAEVFKTWFNVRNERAALANEADCFERHTWLGLDDIICAAGHAGFETRHAEAYPLPRPKFCLYVGTKA